MSNKRILAETYLKLRKQFDGDNYFGKYPTVDELCCKFKIVDLEQKIEAVKFAIHSQNKSFKKEF